MASFRSAVRIYLSDQFGAIIIKDGEIERYVKKIEQHAD